MYDSKKHNLFLNNILKDIYLDSELSNSLGFKGGTACYLFYELPRYSVDLDFNLLLPENKDTVFKRVYSILLKYGTVKDKEKYIKANTIFYVLNYQSGDHHLKIDISTRQTNDKYELMNYLGLTLPVMKKEYMFAHKLVALTSRKELASRDLFDIHYFFERYWDIEESVILQDTGKNIKSYLDDVYTFIDRKINNSNILHGLGELVTLEQKKKIKESLKSETLFFIRSYQLVI